MASALSRSTDTARKGIIVFIIFVIATFLCQFVIEIIEGDPTGPSLTPIPVTGYQSVDNALGDIVKLDIPSITLQSGTNAKFALTGRLPVFPATTNVYEILKPREFLGKVPDARKTAGLLGFSEQESRLTDNILYWDTDGFTRSLSYHKVKQEWNFDVNIATDPLLEREDNQLNSSLESYRNSAPQLLSKLGLTSIANSENFSNANSRLDYINLNSDGSLKKEISSDKASYVKVALYKQVEASSLVENYTPANDDENPATTVFGDVRKINYLDGVANFIIQGTGQVPQSSYIKFDYKEYDYGEKGVYPLISTEQAWSKIQANEGILYWLRPEDKDVFSSSFGSLSVTEFEVNTEKVSIVYIEPNEWLDNDNGTHYLQPYYLMEGIAILTDGRQAEFAFLVEALSSSSYLAQPE